MRGSAVEGADSYDIYRSLVSGGPYSRIMSGFTSQITAYSDRAVNRGQPYYYVVRARGPAGEESAVSNEASGTPKSRLRRPGR